MQWDPAVLQFQSIPFNAPGTSQSEFNLSNTSSGRLTNVSMPSQALTLADGSIQFTAVGAMCNPFDLAQSSGSVTANQPPCPMVCNDLLTVSLNANCEVSLSADQILEANNCPGPFALDVRDAANNLLLSGVNSAVLNGSMGSPLTIEVTHLPTGNKCFGQVELQDKVPPLCSAPPNVSVDCQNYDPSLAAYGTATATDNCCISGITETNTGPNSVLCTGGTVLRSFTVTDCSGNISTCTQTIVVQSIGANGFYIKFPDDVPSSSLGDTYPEPVAETFGCSLVGMGYTDQVIGDPLGCHTILRTWRVIDWCSFDPIVPFVQVPNPEPNTSHSHPQNLLGPTVSAMGTASPWAPTISALVSGGSLVDFSTYWSATATGGYEYVQKIRVGAPTAHTFNVLQKKCGISVTPATLGSTATATYSWGDGSTTGPLLGNAPASHLYTASGMYEICVSLQPDPLCPAFDTCWQVCITCDTCPNPLVKDEWAKFPAATRYVGGNNSHAQMYADATGRFHMVSTFEGSFVNGTDPALPSTGQRDCIVAQYDGNGQPVPGFAFNIGGTGDEIGAVMAAHPGGGFYVGGISYSPTITLPSPGGATPAKTLTNSALQNIFLCRYDANRNLLWGLGMHGANNLQVNEMAVDGSGNVYITGLAHGNIDFNPLGTAVAFPGLDEGYVCKYDPNGQLLWVRLMSGTLHLGLSLDANGDVYIGGHFQGNSVLSGWPVSAGGWPSVGLSTSFPNTSSVAPHVAKFDTNGGFQWAFALQDLPGKTATGAVWDVKARGNDLYITGGVSNNLQVNFDPLGGGAAFQNLQMFTGNFVARYALNGHAEVVKMMPLAHYPFEVEVGPTGKVYVGGYYGGGVALTDVFDANLLLIKSLQTGSGGGFNDVVWALAPDPFGDFGMMAHVKSQQFDADPLANDGLEGTFTDGLTHLLVGKYTCDCPGEPEPFCGPCDSIAARIFTLPNDDDCCATVQVHNQQANYFSAVQVSVVSGGSLAIGDVSVQPGWAVGGFLNGKSVTLKPAAGGFVPTGNVNLASICLSKLTATDQYIEVAYIGLDTICRDTLHFTCDYCVSVSADSIGCDSAGLRPLRFCVSVSPNLGYNINSIVLMPPTGVSISPLSVSVPNLAPGGPAYCFTVYASVPAGTMLDSLCIGFTAHEQDVTQGLPPLRCCMVKTCFALPDCLCDPDLTYATAALAQLGDRDCCWSITLHQQPGLIASVQTNILNPGVTYGAIAPSSVWDFTLRPPQGLDWTPDAGGTLPASIALPTLCLDVPLGSPSPQLLEIVWTATNGSICRQVLRLDCRPKDPCITVDSAQAICVSTNTASLSITVTNTSNPAVAAGEVVLTPVGPAPFTLTPSNFIVNLAPNASTTLTATATGVTSSELWFLVHMHQTAGDTSHLNCCVAEDTLKVQLETRLSSIICQSGVVANLNIGSGSPSALVWVTDLILDVYGRCGLPSPLEYGIRVAGTGTGFPISQPNVTFDCNDLGINTVEIWVKDPAGNTDFCATIVTVQDNTGLCGPEALEFVLYQNTPNPWSERTSIRFRLPGASEATLRVFDAVGRTLYTKSGFFQQGENRFDLDDWKPSSTGVLFYSVETPTDFATRRMVVGK